LDAIILENMYIIIDEHGYDEDLNRLLKTFIQEKEHEQSAWGAITRTTHWMLGGSSPDIDRLASATELIMLALDMIDDLQDRDQMSKPWMQCPEGYTLNAILAFLMGFMGELGRLQANHPEALMKEISRIVSRSINGQHRDVMNSFVTVDQYLSMNQEKSGSLIRLACYLGCSSVPCSQETIQQINDLADYIGLIHQIQNDIKDVTQFDLKNDLLLKKRTLPILYILESKDTTFPYIQAYYEGTIDRDDFLSRKPECMRYIYDSGCIEYAQIIQSICTTKAEEIYEKMEALTPWKEQFRELTYGSFV
jgi:competence protein ComQ